KDPVARSIVITGGCQRFLNIDGHLVRRQSVVAVDRAIVHISHGWRITPCREPIAGVPVPPAVVHENDPVIVASPPTAIVPVPVVIVEGRIAVAAERVATPVISDSYVATAIKGGVLCPVDREVTLAIDRYVIATAKLIRVAKTINVGVLRPVEVTLAIDRYVVPSTRLVRIAKTINIRVLCAIHRNVSFTVGVEVSCPVHREVPVAIHR